jgi:LAO/AO transport system kinase
VTGPDDSVVVVNELRAGSRRALARAISLVESTAPADVAAAGALLEQCAQPPIRTRRIGVTGAPGVGKSTFMETFGLALIERGHRVAVLAVDPTSRRTGGSILGDKVRMPRLSQHDRAFVRPSPSRTALGGAAASTRDVMTLCEAAGYDTIIVETVGVGQSETEVADMVDLFMLLLLPTAGDDVQGIKRGIMEMAHAILVTKTDIDAGATAMAVATFTSAMRLMLPVSPDWQVPVRGVSALAGDGVDAVHEIVDSFFAPHRQHVIDDRRAQQRAAWFRGELERGLMERLHRDRTFTSLHASSLATVVDGSVPPTVAVRRLLERFTLHLSENP